ncbi:MAG: MBL fold metallo-hydrolase, partial [Nitrospinota bacterium]|nr:MBL fold metallo-hydrolase [Nitrospinota bacterium]
FEQSAPFAKEYLVLEEQDELCQRLGVRWMRCPGHSQSDIVYILGKAAFTGDVLLREIFQTPLLDVEMETMERRFCNYKAYCGTILKLKTLEGMELYPSHKEYVDSIDERITWYVEKILDRAAAVAPLLEKGASIRDIVIKLFQGEPLKPFTMFIKISEITFLRDFLADPAPLAEAMRQAGLYDKTAEKFKLLA